MIRRPPRSTQGVSSAASDVYKRQEKNTRELGIPVHFTRVGSMFSTFFTGQVVENFESVKTCDTEFFKRYFNGLLEENIYIAPSQFEAGFMSAIHSDKEIDQTIEASFKALKAAQAQ